ncbi:hypothetical protein TYM08_P0122 [Marinicellulosiphila megalodicopiae]
MVLYYQKIDLNSDDDFEYINENLVLEKKNINNSSGYISIISYDENGRILNERYNTGDDEISMVHDSYTYYASGLLKTHSKNYYN